MKFRINNIHFNDLLGILYFEKTTLEGKSRFKNVLVKVTDGLYVGSEYEIDTGVENQIIYATSIPPGTRIRNP
ncbi:MAG: hypothetical protein IPK08_06210 [Bacteroidetes bacterium]|nr:hypothetical protein [Bacteroidota bacterium]